MNIKKQEKVI